MKNTTSGSSELVGKSVEMITNTIAEIRTYGEGFIIVDQSPSSVDIAAIKNTNTKIILRTPEANDRMAVGRSIGLTDPQVDEIAKLPSGVAVIYQNNWINPVLAMIDKADVDERPFVPQHRSRIMTVKSARKLIVCMLMQPWFGGEGIKRDTLLSAQKVLELKRQARRRICELIEKYDLFNHQLIWRKGDLGELRFLVQDVLDITNDQIAAISTADQLRALVTDRLGNLKQSEINDVCFVLTYCEEE